MRKLVVATFLMIACSIALLAQAPSPQVLSPQALSPQVRGFVKVDAPVVVLTHLRVIDGTGATARDDQTVVISQGKIASISDSGSASVPKDAHVLDLHGYTVIPGLVGMHDHMFYPVGNGIFGEMAFSFPRLYLAGGVTTIRTTGSLEPYTDLELKKQIDKGETPGPKIHVTGPYLEGAGSWALQMHQLTGPEDATKTVNFWLDQGVDNFKAYMFITPAELSAAVAAAHKRGAKVTGHLCSIGFREAAAIGIDDLEHGLLVDTEFLPTKKPGECPDSPENPDLIAKLDVNAGPLHDMILDLVAHHVAVTSTLPVFEMGSFPGRPTLEKRLLDALSPDARNALLWNRVRSTDDGRLKKQFGSEASPWPAAFKKEMEFERAFSQAGGLLLAGLDPTGMGGVIAGFGDQREMELLVEAGFTPVEAIHIATANGAQYLGELDRVGTIAPGKQADLVVIKGDPSKQIEDIENVETVFKDGIGYDSAKLIESVRGVVGSR
ncbi:MAG: amidohydrolase family protein [Terriglobales bacterium]|jgi:imidazolonepropionase-like amidohydrolase